MNTCYVCGVEAGCHEIDCPRGRPDGMDALRNRLLQAETDRDDNADRIAQLEAELHEAKAQRDEFLAKKRDVSEKLSASLALNAKLVEALREYTYNGHHAKGIAAGKHSVGFCQTCVDQYFAAQAALDAAGKGEG